MATFKITAELEVSKNWIEDGVDAEGIKERLETFLMEEMNPYCYARIEYIADVKVEEVK